MIKDHNKPGFIGLRGLSVHVSLQNMCIGTRVIYSSVPGINDAGLTCNIVELTDAGLSVVGPSLARIIRRGTNCRGTKCPEIYCRGINCHGIKCR
jgi:hypothetical protein